MELLLTGDLITADQALGFGFLNRVENDALPIANQIAQKIASNGPIAVQAIRKSAHACLGVNEQDALKLETEISAPVFQSKDAQEGPRAFMEKRVPIYRGK